MLAISLHEARSAPQVDIKPLIAEVLCEMPHRREHKMEPLPMPSLRRDFQFTFDEQDATIACLSIA
jgi:hypothetical protein